MNLLTHKRTTYESTMMGISFKAHSGSILELISVSYRNDLWSEHLKETIDCNYAERGKFWCKYTLAF